MSIPHITLGDIKSQMSSLKKVEFTEFTHADGTKHRRNIFSDDEDACTEIEGREFDHQTLSNEALPSGIKEELKAKFSAKRPPQLRLEKPKGYAVDTEEWMECASRAQETQETPNQSLRVATWNVWFDSFYATER
jgi:hypothetical protein